MNATIILVLDDQDLGTDFIKSINGIPFGNPYLHREINYNGNTFKLYLLHITGSGNIEIKFSGSALTFNSQSIIEIEDKCLVAVSHLNDPHSDTSNLYFDSVNFNGTPVSNIPSLKANFKRFWKRIYENPIISMCEISGSGYEDLILYFNNSNCEMLLNIYNNLI